MRQQRRILAERAASVHGGRAAGVTERSPLRRPCPRCEAAPGQRCQHWVPGAGYFKPIVRIHPERRAARANDPKN